MLKGLISAASGGLLLSVSFACAADSKVGPPAGAAASTAAPAAAHRPPSAPAHVPAQAPNARAWGMGVHPGGQFPANAGAGAPPHQGPRVVAPFAGNARPNFAGPQVVYPPARVARRHVAIRLLAPLIIGTTYFYPYRYLPYEGPVCGGVTENGCELRWMDVPLEDSMETVPQCVEFCPQQ